MDLRSVLDDRSTGDVIQSAAAILPVWLVWSTAGGRQWAAGCTPVVDGAMIWSTTASPGMHCGTDDDSAVSGAALTVTSG